MFMLPPPVQAKQDRTVRIGYLTKVVMGRSGHCLAKERLVPFATVPHIFYANDCPDAFHRYWPPVSPVRSTERSSYLKLNPATKLNVVSYQLSCGAVDRPEGGGTHL